MSCRQNRSSYGKFCGKRTGCNKNCHPVNGAPSGRARESKRALACACGHRAEGIARTVPASPRDQNGCYGFRDAPQHLDKIFHFFKPNCRLLRKVTGSHPSFEDTRRHHRRKPRTEHRGPGRTTRRRLAPFLNPEHIAANVSGHPAKGPCDTRIGRHFNRSPGGNNRKSTKI